MSKQIEAFEEKLSFLDRVTAWKREHYGENCEDASISRVVSHFTEIWTKKQALENQIKEEFNVALKALSDIGLAIMDSEDIKDATVNGLPVWIVDKTYFSIPGKKDSQEKQDNVAKFRAWAEKNGVLEYCYINVLNHKRFEAVILEEGRQGRPLPDGVKVTPDRVLSVNKKQPGKAEREED